MLEEKARALVSAAAKGNQRALEELYAAFARNVKSFVLRVLPVSMRDFSDDVVSQTFVACWQSAARFEGKAQVKTWLLGIARNKALETIRSQGGHLGHEEPETAEEASDDTPIADVIRWLEGREIAAALDHCFDRLSETLRMTVYLAHVEDMGLPEIAATLAVSRETAKSRMRLAIPKLRECLSVRLQLHHGAR